MTINIGTIQGNLTLNVSGFQRSAQQATQATSRLQMGVIAANQALELTGKIFSGFQSTIGSMASSFLEAGESAVSYRIRLNQLLGSSEKGSQMFTAMANAAAKLPYSYDSVMKAATNLSGVMTGGIQEVSKWIPRIADLAAVSGLSFQEATGQIQRMYSAGAASADLFQERGVSAMLGFKAGVSYTAKETRRMLEEVFNDPASKVAGMASKLVDTVSGQFGMIADKWMQFRTAVMDNGLYEAITVFLKEINSQLDKLKESGDLDAWAKNLAKSVLYGVRGMLVGIQKAINGIDALYNKIIEFGRRVQDNYKSWGINLNIVSDETEAERLARQFKPEYLQKMVDDYTSEIARWNAEGIDTSGLEGTLAVYREALAISSSSDLLSGFNMVIDTIVSGLDKAADAADKAKKSTEEALVPLLTTAQKGYMGGVLAKTQEIDLKLRLIGKDKVEQELIKLRAANEEAWEGANEEQKKLMIEQENALRTKLKLLTEEEKKEEKKKEGLKKYKDAVSDLKLEMSLIGKSDADIAIAKLEHSLNGYADSSAEAAANVKNLLARQRELLALQKYADAMKGLKEDRANIWDTSSLDDYAQKLWEIQKRYEELAKNPALREKAEEFRKLATETLNYKTIAGEMRGLFDRMTGSFTTAIDEFMQVGKVSFKKLIKALNDEIRLYVAQKVAKLTVDWLFANAMAAYHSFTGGPMAASYQSAASAAASGLAAITPLAAGITIGGIAHGGLEYVPAETTYLLDKGERVLSPRQNRDLTSFLDGGGVGSGVTIHQNNTFNAGSDETSIRKALPAMKQELIDACASDIVTGGKMRDAVQTVR